MSLHRRSAPKPHPRSLDALFPKPRTVPKAAVKVCARGHRQSVHWQPMIGCSACGLYDEASERIRNHNSRREREEWAKAHPCPPVLTMMITSTGRVLTFSIPKHLMRPRRRRGRARR